MPAPTNRVPVRVARGYLPTLQSSIAQLYEGEIVYAIDLQTLYAVDSGRLIPLAGDGVLSVNGQQGNVKLGIEELNDVALSGISNGDMLVWQGATWVNIPATTGGTVYSVDVVGDGNIVSTGGPITSTGVISLELSDTGVSPGQYNHPRLTVDNQGRITSIVGGTPPNQDLDDLRDVNAPSPGIGDGLIWNGVNWISTPDVGGGAESLGDLDDVDFDSSSPLNGQALIYDSLSDSWIPGTVDRGDPPPPQLRVEDLVDVSIESTLRDWILKYNPGNNLWESAPLELDNLNEVRSVDVGQDREPENGDVLVWDQTTNRWTNRTPNESGPIDMLKFTGLPEDYPLLGGERLLDDEQAWTDLGFIVLNDWDPSEGVDSDAPGWPYWSQSIPWNDLPTNLLDNNRLWGGQVSGIPLLDMPNTEIFITRLGFVISNPNEAPSVYGPRYIDRYDYIDDAEDWSQIEISVATDDIDRFDMSLWRTGIHPLYTDENGDKWTIFRREVVSPLTSGRHWATEIWIGEEGQVWTKNGTPTWGFNWSQPGSSRSGEWCHGIYFDGNKINRANPNPRGELGYGYKPWEDWPDRGGYVNFAGPQELAVPLPPIFLGDLEDVDTNGSVDGQFLKYDGTEWIPSEIDSVDLSTESIDALSDVDTSTTSPQVGQLLQWNGNNWIPADAPESGAGALDDLTDVDVTTPAPVDTQVLAYNEADDEWQAANPRATAGAPTDTTFPGKPGEMRYSETHFYICIAPDTWKQMLLYEIGVDPNPGNPSIGQIVDGGNFLTGEEGTINTILDGGNWTTGLTSDQQDVIRDGGYFTPDIPVLGDVIDGGDFENGTSNGSNFLIDGGNYTTGAPGTNDDITVDGGIITPEPSETPQNGDTIDGGNFLTGAAGTNYYVDCGDFFTGASGSADVTLDGGLFVPDAPGPNDAIDGGDWEFGFSNGSNFLLDGGNWTTGYPGVDGIADGGVWIGPAPGPDATIDCGDFLTGAPGTDFFLDGGNWSTGAGGYEGTADGGIFSENIDLIADGGDFKAGIGAETSEIFDGGDFKTGDVIVDLPVDGGDFTTGGGGNDEGIIDGGEFVV